ncbi:ATP-binding protein [Gordonia sp. PP30]|uniref:sensor histidine kinase n=1 Tax=unclassified Gordonia (in: high G+C Gram-positive bacteria) TaxID=2657482 RepID=UPI001FFF32B2|nr:MULTISPECIES: ATP-binding protein [unclassified Gordonia (in: high G+C Gram-positive bacteria)]UQE77129.1 ATP-binding protein [Gordonia sp. PP30]
MSGPAFVDEGAVTYNSDGSVSRGGLLNLLVTHSESGLAVVDVDHNIVLFNQRAVELGLLRDVLADPVAEVVTEVFATGVDRHFEFVPPVSTMGFVSTGRTMPRTIENVRCVVRLAEHGTSRYALVYGDDDSTNLRVEATRRDFAANVSHELKTPLGAISLMAEAMLESRDDPAAVEHFGHRVLHEATRMSTLINELIGLSRLQEGRIEEFTEVDVDALIDDALSSAAVSAEVGQIELVSDRRAGYVVPGDRTLLLTALNNLLVNAINHSQPGDVVSISRKLVEVDGQTMASIAITDRGIGIAPVDQQRVFERFFRVDKARSRATGGTGLGLAIVKHVAASHGGHIGLWSRPGTGSTFTLYLPIQPSPET